MENNQSRVDAGTTPNKTSQSLSILIADDTEIVREMLTLFLQQLGHRVEGVENGSVAIAKLAANDYDLILMDMQMPVMDGVEATKTIRSLESRKAKVPIIGFTAADTRDGLEPFTIAGVNALLSKPINLAGLKDAITRIIMAKS